MLVLNPTVIIALAAKDVRDATVESVRTVATDGSSSPTNTPTANVATSAGVAAVAETPQNTPQTIGWGFLKSSPKAEQKGVRWLPASPVRWGWSWKSGIGKTFPGMGVTIVFLEFPTSPPMTGQ